MRWARWFRLKTIYDYLDYYKKESFFDYAFNEVDSLIFSLLSYVKFDGIIPSGEKENVLLKDACKKYLAKYKKEDGKHEDWLFPITYPIVESLCESKRYDYVKAYHFVKKINHTCQFGAVTFRLPNGITFISYEGTDSSVVGWKEDLEMVYQFPIPSQTLAKEYFDETIRLFDRTIYVGGHSKGGNLAMYAYMYGKEYYKSRVKQVYNFDGPGFLSNVIESSLYQEMLPKLFMLVPEDSVVGMSLSYTTCYAVPSRNMGILQHDAGSWEVFGGKFAKGTLSKKSKKLHENLVSYVDAMSEEEKKSFVETCFSVFEKSHITNVMQLKDFHISTLLTIMKEIKNIPSSTKRNFVAIVRLLITGMN